MSKYTQIFLFSGGFISNISKEFFLANFLLLEFDLKNCSLDVFIALFSLNIFGLGKRWSKTGSRKFETHSNSICLFLCYQDLSLSLLFCNMILPKKKKNISSFVSLSFHCAIEIFIFPFFAFSRYFKLISLQTFS